MTPNQLEAHVRRIQPTLPAPLNPSPQSRLVRDAVLRKLNT